MIPRLMARRGWNSALVSTTADNPGITEKDENFRFIRLSPNGNLLFLDRAALEFLKREAQDIDVLHLFHITRETLCYGLLYKNKNPRGYLYIKADSYNEQLKGQQIVHSKVGWKQKLLHGIENRLFKKLNLASVENARGVELLTGLHPGSEKEIILLPNGVSLPRCGSASKKKILLTVGRFGGEAKNFELLFRIWPQLRWNGWRMRCVGPETVEFRDKRQRFFKDNPRLEEQVEFVGPIEDRKELAREYSEARVFFLPSYRESFGLALVEALWCGCYLVGTPGMSAFDQISGHGSFGEVCRSDEPYEFIDTFNAIFSGEKELPENSEAARNYARKNFSWEKIIDQLHERITADIRR